MTQNCTSGTTPQIHLSFGNNPKGKRAIGLCRDNFIARAACFQWKKTIPSVQWQGGSTHHQLAVFKWQAQRLQLTWNHVYLELSNKYTWGSPIPPNLPPAFLFKANRLPETQLKNQGVSLDDCFLSTLSASSYLTISKLSKIFQIYLVVPIFTVSTPEASSFPWCTAKDSKCSLLLHFLL